MQPLAIKHDLQPALCNLRYADYNNGLKFSHDRKNYIDFQLDVLGGGGGGILKTSNGRYA